MNEKFYVCRHCGNLVGMLNNSGVPMSCCGEKMEALVPNTAEASMEKHLPVIELEDGAAYIRVGEAVHPMQSEHSIQWIYVQTTRGGRRISLNPGEEPEVTVCLDGEELVAVYAYCNLHGLWMTKAE